MPSVASIKVDFVEIADVHFHHNCALPCLDEKGDLIAALLSVFSYAKDHTDRELVVEGHTTTAPEVTNTISSCRSAAPNR